MPASQPANFNLQEFSDAGLLLLGGRLYTYAYGTTAQKIAYTDPAGAVPHTYTADGAGGQYIALNARGELPAPLYLATGSYDIALKRGDGSTIWTRKADGVDNTPNSLAAALAASTGSSLVSFIQAGVGAVLRTVQAELRDRITAFGYGAKGDNVNDDTAKLQAMVSAVQLATDPAAYASNSPANGSSTANFSSGFFIVSDTLTVLRKVAFRGDGPAEFSSGTRILQNSVNKDLFKVTPIAQGASVSFEDMTMRGAGGGTGDLIHIMAAGGGVGGCNSNRWRNVVFGTPSRFALNIEQADDNVIDGVLFDVSSGSAVALGTAAAAACVSNTVIDKCNFFQIPTQSILLYNVKSLTIKSARVYPSAPANRLTCFVDGYNTLPYQVRNVTIDGGTFENVNSLLLGQTVKNLVISGTTCDNAGAGVGATRSLIELYGACDGVSITGNLFSGSFDTKSFYDDTGGPVTKANITGNTFINTGAGTAQALKCANTNGTIANNTFIGFAVPSVSEQFYTAGNAIAVGVVAVGGSQFFNKTVTGAKQGDKVTLTPASVAWPVPVGIFVTAYVSAPNTVTLRYDNATAGAIGIPNHDFGILVTR